MKFFYSDTFVLPLPDGHRFPMQKYRLFRESVEALGLAGPGEVLEAHRATDDELLSVHTAGYLHKLETGTLSRGEERRIGFPWSKAMVERTRRSSGATIDACRAALEDGFATNLAGGTHHAFADRGEGFCVTNDTAIAARVLLGEGTVRRILVVDADVHQGNGTARIFRGDDSVFTFSIHGAKNFPFDKEESDLDVALPDGADDGEYLEALEGGLEEALERAGDADIAVFLAGSDPYLDDRWGKLRVSKEGLAERDRIVLESLRERRIPAAITMSGGYARDIRDTVEIHTATLSRAARMVDARLENHKKGA